MSDIQRKEEENSKEEEKEGPESIRRATIYDRFLKMVNHVLDVFDNNPVSDNLESNKIEKRYPKFLSKYKLINLQFRDLHFRETFMIQILILLQSFRMPINVMQKKYFRVPDKKELQRVKSRINGLITGNTDRKDKTKKTTSGSESPTQEKKPGVLRNSKISQILDSDKLWVSPLF